LVDVNEKSRKWRAARFKAQALLNKSGA